MLPNLIVIGAQKSASTFIQDCLAEHPDVYMLNGETPAFESPDYEAGALNALEKAFEGKSQAVLAIKRPCYVGKNEVPQRIFEHLPHAKLLAILRDPVDRAVSAYYHNIKYGFIPNIDIEIGMRKILLGEYQKKYPRSSEIIEFGFYYKHLNHYRHFFERNQLCILFHKDILGDRLGNVRKVYEYLGIDSQFIPSALKTHPNDAVYQPARLAFLRLQNPILYRYSADRMRLFSKRHNPLGKMLGKAISSFDRRILSNLLGNQRPEISQSLKLELYSVYNEDISNLEKLINRKLFWC